MRRLLVFALFAVVAAGVPAQTYEITGEQRDELLAILNRQDVRLNELETLLNRQNETLEEQKHTITRLRGTTSELQSLSRMQSETINELEISYQDYMRKSQETIDRTRRQRNRIALGTTSGSTAGAAIGSFVAGPLGAAVGALSGSLLGGTAGLITTFWSDDDKELDEGDT